MTISQIKNQLETIDAVRFQLPNGDFVPAHFHITEVGLITKHFIDCGGTERFEKVANFQLWNADDVEHRLAPKKLFDIISLSMQKIGLGDFEIEVEYQRETIGKYGLDFDSKNFRLTAKQTDCLAKENCGIVENSLQNLAKQTSCCSSESGCC